MIFGDLERFFADLERFRRALGLGWFLRSSRLDFGRLNTVENDSFIPTQQQQTESFNRASISAQTSLTVVEDCVGIQATNVGM